MSRPLTADCDACSGLCCVGPAFDATQGFGYDKPAAEPCRHLLGDARCAIHAERAGRGFTSCIAFDCHGAGQWVSQRPFADDSARYLAFARTRVLHELLAAASRVAPPLVAEIEAVADQEDARPGSVDLAALRRHVVTEAARYVPQKVCSTRSSARGGSDSSSEPG